MVAHPPPELAAVADGLEARTAELVERQLLALMNFPAYARVPPSALRTSAGRNVLRVAAVLRGREDLPPEAAEHERISGRTRALQGIPAEDVVGAYRAVMTVLREEFLDQSTRLGVPVEAILAGTRALWDLTDRFSTELVAARHQIDVEFARRDERQRLAFLQRLLTGTLLGSEVAIGGGAYGLAPDAEYWVSRGRPAATDRQDHRNSLARLLEGSGTGRPFHPLVGSIDGDVVAVTATRPVMDHDVGVLAVAGPAAPAAVSHAFAEATRLLNVALRYHRTGLVDGASLSVRIAVVQENELSEALYARYVAPVPAAMGAMADIVLASVRTYLAHRRHVGETAAAMSVHTNTVRYRLARYEEITGADLGDTEGLIEAWWALEYWVLRREGTRSAPRARCEGENHRPH